MKTDRVVVRSRPTQSDVDAAAVEVVPDSGMLERAASVEAVGARGRRGYGSNRTFAAGSGSWALLLALPSLEVGRSDEVIVLNYVCPEVIC